jgi:hypothetical protein
MIFVALLLVYPILVFRPVFPSRSVVFLLVLGKKLSNAFRAIAVDRQARRHVAVLAGLPGDIGFIAASCRRCA